MPQSLDESVFRVLNAEGDTVGTGFIVADHMAVTCAHVIKGASGVPGATIRIRFYLEDENIDARVLVDPWSPPEDDDVAFLYLPSMPGRVQPLKLASATDAALHPYTSLGFPKNNFQVSARRPTASINGLVTSNGRPRLLELKGEEMYYGMSGAPILDLVLDRVVGMVTSHNDTIHTRIVYATTADVLIAYLPTLAFTETNALARYREYIFHETQYINFAGIPLPTDRQGQVITPTMPLEKVYISLNMIDGLTQREQEAKEQRMLSDVLKIGEYLYQRSTVKEDPKSGAIDPEDALKKYGKIVIIGAPGAGKSTLLRWVARRAISDTIEHIPILIFLREYASIYQVEPTLSLREFGIRQASHGDGKLYKILDEAAQAENVLWLVDGLDEARLSAEKVSREAGNLPGQLIITSRPVGYNGIGLQGLRKFEILPFSTNNVDEFVENWFEALSAAANEQTVVNNGWVEERKAWLKTELKQRPQFARLTHNPLLLTFLATLAGSEPLSPLPETRAGLYKQFINRLYDSWEGKNATEDLRRLALHGFHLLGWALHFLYFAGKPVQEPTRAFLVERLANYQAKGWERPNHQQIEAVLDFWLRAGMLEIWRVGQSEYLTFRHMTFQEFAAGQVLKQCWENNPEQTWLFLRPRLHFPAWQESILLMVSMLPELEQSQLIKMVLRAGSKWEKELKRDLQQAIRMACLITQPSNHLVKLLSKAVMEVLSAKDFQRQAWVNTQIIRAFQPPGSIWKHEILRKFLKNRGLFVASEAVQALGKLDDWEAVFIATKAEEWNVRKAAINALDGFEDKAIILPYIREAINDEEFDVRSEAFRLLQKFDDRKTLRDSLSSKNSDNRFFAINALASLNDRDSIKALRQALNDESADVRESAVWALGELNDQESLVLCRKALLDSDDDVRTLAAEALAKLGDIEALRSALKDKNDNVRKAAAHFLGNIGDPELLKFALEDPNMDVRKAAAYSLYTIRDRELLWQALRNEDSEVADIAMSLLFFEKDELFMTEMQKGLQNEDVNIRYVFAYMLGKMGHLEAIPVLRQVLYEEEGDVCFESAVTLGELGYVEALPILNMAVIMSTKSNLRESAVKALGYLGNIGALPALRHAMKDKDPNVRYSVGDAIKQLAIKIDSSENAQSLAREIKGMDFHEAKSILIERIEIMELQRKPAYDLLLVSKPRTKWRQLFA